MIGSITIWSNDPPIRMSSLLGEGSSPPSGYGGWTVTARPKRVSLTEWEGVEPLRVPVPILVDGWSTGNSSYVEQACRSLERMAGLDEPRGRPPFVHFNAQGAVAHDYATDRSRDWVIEDIEWGDELRGPKGKRLRALATVTFLEHIEDERLSKLTSASRRRASKKKNKRGAHSKKYTVKRGDSLSSIAARKLGKASRWKEIAKLNHIRDSKGIKPGQVLKLP